MGVYSFFSNLFYPGATEQRSTGAGYSTSGSYGLTDPRLGSILDSYSLNSGPVSVNEYSVTSLPIAYRCVDLLSNSFASLPWDLYKVSGTTSVPAIGHPVRGLLTRPHPEQTSFVWRKSIMVSMLWHGNGYARIIRNGIGRPVEFKLYHPNEVSVTTDLYRNVVFYRFIDVPEPLPSSEVIHYRNYSTDGIVGKSPIRMHAESFKFPLQSRRFATSLLQNGARPASIIGHKKSLSDKAKQNIKGGWFEDHGGTDRAGGVAVLDEDMTYQSVGINPVDAQLLEIMNLSGEEICSIFGVPQHMAGILRKSTNNNIEHQGLEFGAYSLRPHVVNFNQEFDYKALRAQEFRSIISSMDMNAVQLQDLASQQAFYQFAFNNSIMNADEIRDKLNLNPRPGGDKFFVQGGTFVLDENGMPMAPPSAPKTPAPANGHKLNAN